MEGTELLRDRNAYENRLMEGIWLYESGNANKSIKILGPLCTIAPYDYRLYLNLGGAYIEMGRPWDAIRCLKRAIELNRTDPKGYNAMGVALSGIGRMREAEMFFKKALEFKPDMESAIYNLNAIKDMRRETPFPDPSLLQLLSPPRISLCMIAKDEEDFIARCLDSVKEVVGQIIVVDTGSTDRTKEVAREFGAEVYQIRWEDDFSKARNYSLSLASGDWILVLDADEWMDPGSKDPIKAIVSSPWPDPFYPPIYMAKMINYLDDEENPAKAVIHFNPRLFPNDPSIKFRGRIHEQVFHIDRFGRTEDMKIMAPDILIHHIGYTPKVKAKKGKKERNVGLLVKSMEEMPEEPFHYYNFGIEMFNTDPEKALSAFLKSIELNEASGSKPYYMASACAYAAGCLIKLNRAPEGLELCEKGLEIIPEYPDLWLNKGIILSEIGDLEGAMSCFERAIECRNSPIPMGVDAGASSWKAYLWMGNIRARQGRFKDAISFYGKAIEEGGDERELLPVIANAFMEIGGWEDAIRCARRLEEIGADPDLFLPILVDASIKSKKTHEAIRKIEHFRETYSKASLLMARCHHAMGNYKDAIEHYTRYMESRGISSLLLSDRGICYHRIGMLEEAKRDYLLALELDPLNCDALCNMGVIAMEEGKMEEAAEFFQKALFVMPGHPDSMMNLARVKFNEGRYAEAIGLLVELTQIHPEKKEPFLLLVHCYKMVGDLQASYDTALSLIPKLEDLREIGEIAIFIGELLQEAGKWEEAMKWFLRASECLERCQHGI